MARLDPTSLRVYLATVETGTIAAAAEREHLAAAAISKRISELEAELGCALLSRTNKGVEPTEAGAALVHLARRALHELDGVYRQMREYAGGMRGQVRVFANISAISQFLPDELQAFRVRHPEIRVQLEEKISTVITRAVAENEADIGIYASTVQGRDLEVFDYHADRLVLIARADHPLAGHEELAFADTLDHDYVGLHTGSAINMLLLRAASECDRALNFSMQVTSYDALCLMVHSGLGVGVLPRRVARRHVRTLGLRAVRLAEPWAERELKLCVRSYAALAPAARLMVDHLRSQARLAIAIRDGGFAKD